MKKPSSELPGKKLTLLLLGAALTSPFAQAKSLTGDHDLSAAAGVVSPSQTLSAFENPAGLIYTTQTSLNAGVAFPDSSMNNPLLEAGLYLGNGNIGGAAGVIKPTATGANSSAFYGVGASLSNLHLSLGLNGSTMLSGGTSSSLNLGALIGSYDKLRIGIAVMNFTNSTREWDGGLSYQLSSEMSLLGDFSFDANFGNPWLQPGVLVHVQNLSLTGSYGFGLGTANNRLATNFTDGLNGGLGYRFSPKFALKAYYQHVSKYYAELTFSL